MKNKYLTKEQGEEVYNLCMKYMHDDIHPENVGNALVGIVFADVDAKGNDMVSTVE